MPPSRSHGQLTDDRGRPIAARALRSDLLGGDGPGPRDPQLADLRLRAQLSAVGRRPVWVHILIGALSGAFGAASVMLIPRFMPGVPIWLPMLVVVFTVIVVVRLVRARRTGDKRLAIAAEMFLREGRCPGCAYILDGVPTDADGKRLCPECGAAWRAERVGTAATEAPALREYRRRVFRPTQRERWIPGMRGLLLAPDDRGRSINVTNPRLRGLDDADRARIGDERIARIRRSATWRHRTRGFIIGVAFAPGLFIFGRMLLTPPSASTFLAFLTSFGTFVIALVMLIVILGVVVSMLFGDGGLNGKAVARAFIREGVCPQCLGLMSQLTPDDQGITECPGCGAGWKPAATPAAMNQPVSAIEPGNASA